MTDRLSIMSPLRRRIQPHRSCKVVVRPAKEDVKSTRVAEAVTEVMSSSGGDKYTNTGDTWWSRNARFSFKKPSFQRNIDGYLIRNGLIS
jgi:hypothetical protein